MLCFRISPKFPYRLASSSTRQPFLLLKGECKFILQAKNKLGRGPAHHVLHASEHLAAVSTTIISQRRKEAEINELPKGMQLVHCRVEV